MMVSVPVALGIERHEKHIGALKLFEEGVECLRLASQELATAEASVQRLVEREDGSFELTDLRG